MLSDKGRLIIVDPSLKDNRGHHYSLTRNISISASDYGCEVVVLSNVDMAASFSIPGAAVIPCFSLSTYDHFKKIETAARTSSWRQIRQKILNRTPESVRYILRTVRGLFVEPPNQVTPETVTKVKKAKNGDIVEELVDSLTKLKVSSDDHVLIHTADGILYRAILKVVQKNVELGGTVNFHLCTPYDMNIMPHSSNGLSVDRVINYLKLMGAINRNVFLYAENDLLAEHLSQEWVSTVEPLDIPMKRIVENFPSQKNNNVRVIYLGAAREEKGFHLLPDIIEDVINSAPATVKIEFVLQCSPQIVGYTYVIEQAVERLKQLEKRCNMTLILEQQSMEEYNDVLHSADIVLLCYKRDNYKVRGSGVATEAVASAKNVVSTAGTYPAWLAGEAGLTGDSPSEIAAAILEIAGDREEFARRAESRSDWFYAKSDPGKYIEKLIANENRRSQQQSQSSGAGEHLIEKDDSATKSGYNRLLCEAGVSEDGKVLFVKQ